MRGIWLDDKGVSDIEVADDWMSRSDIMWDCVSLDDGHDIWIDDEGLFRPNPVLATIGPHRNLPLPALILGCDGERTIGATHDVERIRAMSRLQSAA